MGEGDPTGFKDHQDRRCAVGAEFGVSGRGDPLVSTPQLRALRRALLLHERRTALLRRRQRGVQPRRLPIPPDRRGDENASG